MSRWFGRSERGRHSFSPYGVEARGFHGKNFLADQLRLVGENAKVIFDVGANTGQTSREYLPLFPKATIHAFEPFPDSHGALQELSRQEPRVVCHQLAIANFSGTTEFFGNRNPVTNSMLRSSDRAAELVGPGHLEAVETIEVRCTTLDEFCEQARIDSIDILKLDIQGSELRALQGASGLLSRHKAALVYAECLFVPLYEGQGWYWEIAGLLEEYGYRLFDFYNFTYADDGQLRWGDAIFLPHNQARG